MDKSRPYTVAQGTVITSAVSAFVTGIYGITTGRPNHGLLASTAALNSGITAATFFSLREYAISPLLVHTLPWPQYERRRRELGHATEPDSAHDPAASTPARIWADKRKHNLLDSGLSGAATGGILRGWKAGPAAVLPGAVTAAAICVLLQYAVNEADIARLRYISQQRSASTSQPPVDSSLQHTSAPEPSPSLMQRLMHAVGVRKMTEDEYLEKMKKTRDHHLQRIAELELKLEAERGDGKNHGP